MKKVLLFTFLLLSSLLYLPRLYGEKIFAGPKAITHTVQKGEEIMKISYKYYGTHQKWREIIKANPKLNPRALQIGLEILIPHLSKKYIKEHKAQFAVVDKKVEKKERSPAENKNNFKRGPTPKKVTVKKDVSPKVKDLIEKNEKVTEELIDTKEENISLRESIQEYNKKIEALERFEDENEDLKNEIANSKEEIVEFKKKLLEKIEEKERIASNSSLKLPSLLGLTQDQILQEKNRILSSKYWIESNRNFEKCELNFIGNEEATQKKFNEFVIYLNEFLGSDHVFVDHGKNNVTFQLEGKTIYGVNTPKVNSKYLEMFSKLSHFIRTLPIENIHIAGHSPYVTVKSESGRSYSGTYFSLKQALHLQNHFVQSLGLDAHLFTSGSFGKPPGKNVKKRFDVTVRFKQGVESKQKREVVSFIEDDEVLKNIKNDIYQKLQEPKYGHVLLGDEGLELHLGRHYFFADNQFRLTKRGKAKLDTIMEMFALVNDSRFQIMWVPGQTEVKTSRNQQYALIGVSEIKEYLEGKYNWLKDRLEVGHSNRHQKLVDTYNSTEDKHNQRIVFKLLSQSVNVREIGEPR